MILLATRNTFLTLIENSVNLDVMRITLSLTKPTRIIYSPPIWYIARPCIPQTCNRRCVIIFGLVRLNGRSRRAPAPSSGVVSRAVRAVRRAVRAVRRAVRAVRAVRRVVRAVRRSGPAVRRGVCLEVTEKRVILAVDEKSDSRSWWEKSNSRSWRE